jgi:hypothetical protein
MESAQHFSVKESAYYSIKWAHSLAGVNNPCDSEEITYLVDAARRKLNRPSDKASPVTMYMNYLQSVQRPINKRCSDLKGSPTDTVC